MNLHDIRLHRRIQQGDIGAFETVFKTWYAPLCAFALRFVNDSDEAEELVQEFFYAYWKNRENIRIRLGLKAYMYQAVKNLAIKQLNHREVRLRYSRKILSELNQGTSHTEEYLNEKELRARLEKSLEDLPGNTREIFLLSREEGLRYQDIAHRLSISEKTVEAHMTKALRHLRKTLGHTSTQ